MTCTVEDVLTERSQSSPVPSYSWSEVNTFPHVAQHDKLSRLGAYVHNVLQRFSAAVVLTLQAQFSKHQHYIAHHSSCSSEHRKVHTHKGEWALQRISMVAVGL